jgi:cell division protein FtsQ
VAISRTGLFHVRGIEVEGGVRRSVTQIARLSGITARDNALWLPESAAEARLLRDPWIARAHVEIDLPWTVTITVTERSPIASTLRGSERALVAADGTILGTGRAAGLPVIDAPPSWVDPAGTEQIAQAAWVLAALDDDVLSRVRRVIVGGPRGLELLLTDGLRVMFGPPGDDAAKARVMREVLRWIERSDGRFRAIDVSAPSAPAVIPGA